MRVLSEGNNGSVDQSNESKAKSFAGNKNTLTQDRDPGPEAARHAARSQRNSMDSEHGDKKDPCGCQSGVGIQAGGQEAYNKQKATSNAESKQIKPTNQNISVRVLSPGDDGDVSQTNSSTALSGAFNKNDTTQSIDQSQAGSGRCGVLGRRRNPGWGPEGVQLAARRLERRVKADPPDQQGPLGAVQEPSEGHGGTLSQANSSFAGSLAANKNVLYQTLTQSQGS